MKLSRKYSGVPEFNMLALLDIIFLVVIFCIVGMTRMVFLEIVDVKNPELRITEKVEPEDFVTISVTKDGMLFFNKEQLSSDTELSRKLAEKKKSGNDVTVIINGDTDAPLGDALHILQAVREADLPKVFFKTDSSGKG